MSLWQVLPPGWDRRGRRPSRAGRSRRSGRRPCVPGCVVGSTARGKRTTLVGRPGARVVRPGDARVERPRLAPKRVAADERLDVVVGVAGDERADDGELVGQRGELREGAAEGHAGERGGDLAGGAADALGRGHLRVERLELARPAVQEQEDDRLARQQPGHRLRPRTAARTGRRGPARPPRARHAPPIRRKDRRVPRASRSKKVSMADVPRCAGDRPIGSAGEAHEPSCHGPRPRARSYVAPSPGHCVVGRPVEDGSATRWPIRDRPRREHPGRVRKSVTRAHFTWLNRAHKIA